MKAIPDVLVHVDADMGYTDEPVGVIIVDKARQQVRLYQHANQWRTIAKWPCSTGKKPGRKEREVNQKTPVGVYIAVREVGQNFLSDTYGSRALPYFVLLFDNYLTRGGFEEWAGYRKLYFSIVEDRVSVSADSFQAAPKTANDPLFQAWRKLWQKNEQRSKMAATLSGDKNS